MVFVLIVSSENPVIVRPRSDCTDAFDTIDQ